ncbi:MAG: hypothetical protein GWN94_18275 [Phycisphaerae bacterium]|nr:hypothetical protein [Phycisphaerae bacterium]NIS53026.1 hypothetical protein [Phycisphaerae bacterium]NIX00498.1 hypothetical protein [Phycisphaerae bacterium]NIX29436.1 hypothetical protein [Phycisphaerae bacterium]
MSTPVKEYITENIKTAINAITVANGFNQDLTAVRSRRNDFSDITPKDKTVLVKQLDPDKPQEQAYSTIEWVQFYALMAIVLDDDDETASIDTRINQVEADIHKKIREDPKRNNNAIDTELLPTVQFSDDKGFTGISVNIAVRYRVKENDPYTKA